VVKSNIL